LLWNRSVNQMDPRPRQRDSLADASTPDEETGEWRRLFDLAGITNTVGMVHARIAKGGPPAS